MDVVAKDRPLHLDQHQCATRRLDQNTGLRDGLAGDPRQSPQWNELLGVIEECELAVSFATEFAESVVAAAPDGQSAERATCIRQKASELTPSDVGALIEAAGNGGESAGSRDAQGKVDALLSACGVDVAALRAKADERGSR